MSIKKNDIPGLKEFKKSYAYRHVFNAIKGKIVSGSLKPGDRLPSENELSLNLNLGRSAVREGLRELEAVGLVRTVSGKKGGRFVNKLGTDFIVEGLGLVLQLKNVSFEQYMDARKVIESAAAEMAAFKRTPADLAEMLRALTLMRQSRENRDVFFKSNYLFHKAMVGASHNTVLIFIIQALQKLVLNYFDFFTLEKIEIDTGNVYKLHCDIYSAIKDRDVPGSRESTVVDLDDFVDNFQKYYRESARKSYFGVNNS